MGLPLLLRGKKLSHTERDATVLSASQTADPLFPLSRLGDGRPSQLFMFPSRLEDDWFQADISQYLNGDFENWTSGVPNDHTANLTGTATLVEETVSPIFSGGSSMELNNGASGTIEVLQSIEAQAGETIEFRYVAATSNADSPATLEIFNPYTRKWLTTAGTWSSKRQNAIEETGTAFPSVLDVLTFAVENFSTVRNHIVELEVRYHMDGAAATRTHHWDAVEWIPETNFASIHAHNLSPNIVPRLVSADESLETVPIDRAFGFDGSVEVVKNSGFTGAVDAKVGTISIWFRLTSGNATNLCLFCSDNDTVKVFRRTDNLLNVLLTNPSSTVIGNILSTTTVTADGAWHHLLVSWNLAALTGKLYLDGVSDLSGSSTFSNDTVDYTVAQWHIGVDDNAGTQFMKGHLSEIWFDPTSFIDPSIATNLSLFRTSAGKAALLGDSGELVTGTAPILYWRGDEELVNQGTGGDFDSAGALTVPVKLVELVKQDIAFYASFVAENRRYWKMHFRGLNAVDPIEIGLWVIGPAITPAWSPRLGLSETRRIAQSIAVVESSGEQWRVKKGKHPRRTATLSFNLKNTAQSAFRDELLERTSQGADPIVLVENKAATKVIHGRIPPESEFTFQSFELEQVDMVVEESSNGIGLHV